MKKYSKTVFIALGLVSALAFAQTQKKQKNEKIPQQVLASFHKDYPQIKDVDWDEENGNYEAEFAINKEEISVTYNSQGQKLETEKEIKVSQLPAPVLQYVKSKQLGKIKEASKIEKADGKTEYEAEIKGKDYLFDASGKFLKIAD